MKITFKRNWAEVVTEMVMEDGEPPQYEVEMFDEAGFSHGFITVHYLDDLRTLREALEHFIKAAEPSERLEK